MEARALSKEKRHTVVLIVERVVDELCMELLKMMKIGYFGYYVFVDVQ
jgi:hypothetical protein